MTDNLIRVKVKPNAKKTRIVSHEEDLLKVEVAAPAEDNKANIELVKFLSKKLKKKVRIKSGFRSKEKVLFIA